MCGSPSQLWAVVQVQEAQGLVDGTDVRSMMMRKMAAMMTGAMAMGMKIALKKLEPRRRSLRITASSSPSPPG